MGFGDRNEAPPELFKILRPLKAFALDKKRILNEASPLGDWKMETSVKKDLMGMINNLKNLAGASDSIIAGRFVANGMLSWRSSSVRDATFKFSLDHRRGYNEEHQALIAEDFYPMNTPDKSMKDTEETKKATTTTTRK